MKQAPIELVEAAGNITLENRDADSQFVLKRPSSMMYRRFKSDIANSNIDIRMAATTRLVQATIVWPDWVTFEREFVENGFPVLTDTLAEAVIRMSGGVTSEAQKKTMLDV